MAKEGVKKRGWVKNAIIIFLIIMLLLTFFSNTIMNYSLPEVAAQYTQPGTITTKVRSSATVEANQRFEIFVDETRVIKSVNVKNGDAIEAGQTIFVLEDTESNELATAQRTLDELNLAYEKALLSIADPSYAQENQTIKELKEDLNEAISQRDKISGRKEALDSAKKAVKSAQKTVDNLSANLETLQQDLSDASDDSKYINELYAITAAESALSAAEQRRDAIQQEVSSSETSDNEILQLERNLESLQLELQYLQKDFQNAQMAQNNASSLYANYMQLKGNADAAKTTLDALMFSGTASEAEIAAATANYESLSAAADAAYSEYNSLNSSAGDITSLQHQIDKMNIQIRQVREDLDIARLKTGSSSSLKAQLESVKYEVENCKTQLQNAKNNLQTVKNQSISNIRTQIDTTNAQLKAANQSLADARDKQTEAESENALTIEQANEQIKTIQRNLQDQYIALAEKQDSDDLKLKLEELYLDAQRAEIEKQEKIIADIKSKTSETEIKAKYAGIINSISTVAGDSTTPGTPMGTIDVIEKGYTATFPVTIEQAKMIRVDDKAEIENMWYTNAEAKVTAIKNDPANPGKGKILEITVTGDVTVGQQLYFSIGERGIQYDTVVPNSAVREDNNGKFILIVESRNSPLGTRYVASRVDVEVKASDDNFSAVTGNLYGYEFVITTSNKPVQAGELVRLPE
ncbi:MAG: hypothetical protein GX633_07990 [Clostridiales bacterium]|nr:hypothetical protein [Clostridiales bacterium]